MEGISLHLAFDVVSAHLAGSGVPDLILFTDAAAIDDLMALLTRDARVGKLGGRVVDWVVDGVDRRIIVVLDVVFKRWESSSSSVDDSYSTDVDEIDEEEGGKIGRVISGISTVALNFELYCFELVKSSNCCLILA